MRLVQRGWWSPLLAVSGLVWGLFTQQGTSMTLDQRNDVGDVGMSCGSGVVAATEAQSFIPTLPLLCVVELDLIAGGSFPTEGYMVKVRIRDGAFDGPVLAESSSFIVGPKGVGQRVWVSVPFDNLPVKPGNLYVIEFDSPDATIVTWQGTIYDSYSRGHCAVCSFENPAADFNFLTYGSQCALAQTLQTLEDKPLAITLGALGGAVDLAFAVKAPPSHGTLSGIPPNIVYTPAPDFYGSDSFTFVVMEGGQDTSLPAEIAITVVDVLMGLASISPEHVIAGHKGDLALTVNGSDFEPDTTVYWNGNPRTTTYIDAEHVTALVSESDLAGGADIQRAFVTVGEPTVSESGRAIFLIVPTTVGRVDRLAVDAGESGTLSVPRTSTEPGVEIKVQNTAGDPVAAVVATYSTKPLPDNVFQIVYGSFIDVQLTGADSDDIALACFSYPSSITGVQEEDLKLRYYTGTSWASVLSSNGADPGKDMVNDWFTVQFDATSTPKITELTGTIFGMFESPQILGVSCASTLLAAGGSASVTVDFATANVTTAPCDVLFAWGDGAITPASSSERSITQTHQYAAPGVYRVEVTVSDDEGGSAMSAFEYVVVYDPTGGFVTGGGWINSPLGACVVNPALTGKATFGFVSKYLKGATVPSGNTEFQFKAGDLNFKSTSYQWLVVAGARAQFKGEGTINGDGSYGFLLTAIDGQVNGGGGADRFRIKIWDTASDALVYDNQVGTGDNAELGGATVIQGGSIVIHKP